MTDGYEPRHTLRLNCSKAALTSNWRMLNEMSGTAATAAAVKADGYGLGAVQVVETLYEAGCRDFYVAHWQEAPPLFDVLKDANLSILHGFTLADEISDFQSSAAIKPVLNSMDQVRRWLDQDGGRCDVMVDTGINRLGLSMSEIDAEELSRLDIDVCMSHLASADEDTPQNRAQLDNFRCVKDSISAKRYSLANSAGIALGANYHFDLVRPGLALYGGIPRKEFQQIISPVVELYAMVLQIRNIKPGESVGYNARFTATAPMRMAVMSLGYADGYLRLFYENGRFLFEDKFLPVIGRISMDLVCVNISGLEGVSEGDFLRCAYDLSAASAATGLSQYELLTILGQRFDKNWT